MNKLRIVFMGTPDFAVPSLEKLHQNHNVVGVITAPDRKAGRGQKIRYSAVKEFALQEELRVLQPTNLKAAEFQNELRALEADLFVVVAFRMLPEAVWSMPPMGTINLHGSLLPQYRGAAPINWAVINGEKVTGVTTFFIEKEIDTGKIIRRHEIPIGPNESAGELHDEMMVIGAQVLLETVNTIGAGQAQAIDQQEIIKQVGEIKHAPKIFKDDCEINWSLPVDAVHDFIRGLAPYPAAWTTLNQKQFKILKGSKTVIQAVTPGEIHTDLKNFIRISSVDFQYEIHELQMQGKKKMSTTDFLRGNSSVFES